jgi:hypothetical protein
MCVTYHDFVFFWCVLAGGVSVFWGMLVAVLGFA